MHTDFSVTRSHVTPLEILASLTDNPALLAGVLESAGDRGPPTVRSLHSSASAWRFPRSSTAFEYRLVLGEVVRRLGS